MDEQNRDKNKTDGEKLRDDLVLQRFTALYFLISFSTKVSSVDEKKKLIKWARVRRVKLKTLSFIPAT